MSGDLGEEVRGLGEHAREIGHHAKEAVREKMGDVRRGASELYSRGRDRANEAVKGLEHYVQEQPIKSLLIAVGAGLLLGAIIRRR